MLIVFMSTLVKLLTPLFRATLWWIDTGGPYRFWTSYDYLFLSYELRRPSFTNIGNVFAGTLRMRHTQGRP